MNIKQTKSNKEKERKDHNELVKYNKEKERRKSHSKYK